MSIVVVDASAALHSLERAVLARAGMPLVPATPTNLGDILRQVPARVVLVVEPCPDLQALCRAARAAAGRDTLPVLLLVHDDSTDAEARARAAGAAGVVPRPLTRGRLARRLRAVLGGGLGLESRDSARVPVRVPLLFGLQSPDVTGYLYNLSRTGLFVMSERTFPAGTTLLLRLQLPNSRREFEGRGKVVWVNRRDGASAPPAPAQPPGMGIEFLELPPDTRNLVDLLVARLTRTGSAAG
jgi:uncharacterized protein (TIGR02266 family)